MNVRTYRPGDHIEVSFDFESYVTKIPRTVTAEFVHEQDPETVLRLTGKPQTSGVSVEPNRNYRTRLYSTVNPSDKPGLYTIKALHADYGQGDPISFVQLPEDEFRIERAAIPPPKVRSVLKWNREYPPNAKAYTYAPTWPAAVVSAMVLRVVRRKGNRLWTTFLCQPKMRTGHLYG